MFIVDWINNVKKEEIFQRKLQIVSYVNGSRYSKSKRKTNNKDGLVSFVNANRVTMQASFAGDISFRVRVYFLEILPSTSESKSLKLPGIINREI